MSKLLEEMRKFAGIPVAAPPEGLKRLPPIKLTEEDVSAEHIAKEREVFNACIKSCEEILKMCEARLKEKGLSDEHRKQYTEMCACTKEHVAGLKKHLASYK